MIRNTALTLLVVGCTGFAVTAQQPTTPPPSPQPSQQQRSPSGLQALDGQTVTLSGCLKREADVAGQQPSAVERAGIMPDFILTDVQVKSASPSGGTPGRETAAPPSAGGTNIKLVKVDNDEMNKNLNRQVEVTGRFDASPGAGAATTRERPPAGTGGAETTGRTQTARDRELPELEVQSVRVTGQSCTPRQ
jgi:hypothetical protein